MSDAVYRVLDARLPHHAGTAAGGLRPVPVARLGDEAWVGAQLALAGRRYGCSDLRVLGVLWWYSASSVAVAPVAESVVAAGVALDASTVTLYLGADGRPLGARASAVSADPGPRLHAVLSSGITAVAAVSGAGARSLWAIATDSIGNRVLWAGGGPAQAEAIAAAVGPDLPAPRFVVAGGRPVVRRASCCLIYLATGEEKCVTCPRQPPAVRAGRLARI